jgi:hypothetical protein
MENFGAEPPPKRKRVPADENKLYKFASHRWQVLNSDVYGNCSNNMYRNVEKAGRNGATPRAEDIPLVRPGEIQQMNFTKSSIPARRSETRSSPSETRRSSVAEEPLASDAGNIPISCFYWSNDLPCPAGERQCLFSHRKQDRVAERHIHEQALENGQAFKPKFFSPTEVCFYWAKGSCRQSDTVCWFAHWYPSKGPWIKSRLNDRKTMTARSKLEPDSPLSRDPSICRYWLKNGCWTPETCKFSHRLPGSTSDAVQQLPQESARKVSNALSNSMPHKIQKTCPYWYHKNKCKLSAETCQYVHENLDVIADWAGSRKVCPFWANGSCKFSAEDCKYLHQFLDNAPVAGKASFYSKPSIFLIT